VRRLQKQRDAEQQQLQQARIDVAKLRAHADSIEKDSATLERVAREKYGLVKPGERLYRFTDKHPSPADSARKSP
jgi:cell division protein FtsB